MSDADVEASKAEQPGGSGATTEAELADQATAEREINRTAVRDEQTAQDIAADNEAAESRTAFGDDLVTPHLNDGR